MSRPQGGTAGVRLEFGGTADLDDLEPLWLTIHERHTSCMPGLAPYVDDATSWAVRRELYRTLLDRSGTQLALATHGGRRIGYCLAYVTHPDERSWIADTWDVRGEVAEIESLGVLPAYRGQRVGERLLASVERRLQDSGIHHLVLGALAGNLEAVAFYTARGYVPTWTYLSKWADRGRASSPDEVRS